MLGVSEEQHGVPSDAIKTKEVRPSAFHDPTIDLALISSEHSTLAILCPSRLVIVPASPQQTLCLRVLQTHYM